MSSKQTSSRSEVLPDKDPGGLDRVASTSYRTLESSHNSQVTSPPKRKQRIRKARDSLDSIKNTAQPKEIELLHPNKTIRSPAHEEVEEAGHAVQSPSTFRPQKRTRTLSVDRLSQARQERRRNDERYRRERFAPRPSRQSANNGVNEPAEAAETEQQRYDNLENAGSKEVENINSAMVNAPDDAEPVDSICRYQSWVILTYAAITSVLCLIFAISFPVGRLTHRDQSHPVLETSLWIAGILSGILIPLSYPFTSRDIHWSYRSMIHRNVTVVIIVLWGMMCLIPSRESFLIKVTPQLIYNGTDSSCLNWNVSTTMFTLVWINLKGGTNAAVCQHNIPSGVFGVILAVPVALSAAILIVFIVIGAITGPSTCDCSDAELQDRCGFCLAPQRKKTSDPSISSMGKQAVYFGRRRKHPKDQRKRRHKRNYVHLPAEEV